MAEKRILVCGGRWYARLADDEPRTQQNLARALGERLELYAAIEAHCNRTPEDDFGNWLPCDTVIIHGGAKGADTVADDWAVTNFLTPEVYHADWGTHKRAAGIIRNAEMLRDGKPGLVIAAKGGNGTAHMVSIAEKAGVPVIKVGW